MKIYLRPVTLEDGKLIVRWRNAPQVSGHCFNKKPITEESNCEFYHRYVETGQYKQYMVERMEENLGVLSYPIATVYLKDVDVTNRRCELCIFTSNDEEWNTKSQSLAIKQLLKIAFEECGMHKVYSYVFSKYVDEVELLKRAGFTEEALLRREALDEDGSFADAYRMVVFAGREDI